MLYHAVALDMEKSESCIPKCGGNVSSRLDVDGGMLQENGCWLMMYITGPL